MPPDKMCRRNGQCLFRTGLYKSLNVLYFSKKVGAGVKIMLWVVRWNENQWSWQPAPTKA